MHLPPFVCEVTLEQGTVTLQDLGFLGCPGKQEEKIVTRHPV